MSHSPPRRIATKTSSRLRIKIKTCENKAFYVSTKQTNTIHELQTMIQNKKGIPLHDHDLIFSGRLLEDARTLEYYNIKKNSTIHIKPKDAGVDESPVKKAQPPRLPSAVVSASEKQTSSKSTKAALPTAKTPHKDATASATNTCPYKRVYKATKKTIASEVPKPTAAALPKSAAAALPKGAAASSQELCAHKRVDKATSWRRMTLRRAKFNYKYKRRKKQKPRLNQHDVAAYTQLLKGTKVL